MSLWKRRKDNKDTIKTNGIIQENPEECIKLVEQGFLKDVFLKDSVTDLSYNGEKFYALDNDIGRYRLNIEISSDEVLTFIKKNQI